MPCSVNQGSVSVDLPARATTSKQAHDSRAPSQEALERNGATAQSLGTDDRRPPPRFRSRTAARESHRANGSNARWSTQSLPFDLPHDSWRPPKTASARRSAAASPMSVTEKLPSAARIRERTNRLLNVPYVLAALRIRGHKDSARSEIRRRKRPEQEEP